MPQEFEHMEEHNYTNCLFKHCIQQHTNKATNVEARTINGDMSF